MNEFEAYLDQTRGCLRGRMYYPALAMALALPDICSWLAYGVRGNYRERYERWLTDVGTFLAVHPEWVWRVRCAFLHDGASHLGPNRDQGRIVLLEPPKGPVHSTTGTIGPGKFGIITVEIDELVGSLVEAAARWARLNASLIEEKVEAGELLVIQPNVR